MDFYGITIKEDLAIDADNTHDIGGVATRAKVVYAVTFDGEATSSQWGDLGEKYTCYGKCDVGTLMCVSSSDQYDLETCNEELSSSYVGVISESAGFIMNSKLQDAKIVGMVGRLPVKIMGKINKKDFIVPTEGGCARAGRKGEEAFKIGVCNATKDTDDVSLVECIIK